MATVDQAYLSNEVTTRQALENVPTGTAKIDMHPFDAGKRTLSPTTTPPVSLAAHWTAALVTGALDIDLRALPGLQGNFDAAGKKLQVLRIQNDADHAVTIGPGASNGYQLFGSTNTVTIPAGGKLTMEFVDSLPDVDATHKVITLTGTGTDSVKVDLLLG